MRIAIGQECNVINKQNRDIIFITLLGPYICETERPTEDIQAMLLSRKTSNIINIVTRLTEFN